MNGALGLLFVLPLVAEGFLATPSASRPSFALAFNEPRRPSPINLYCSSSMAASLRDVKTRDESYKGNMAKYLVDLHDSKAVFDFCGGMMFQLVLSDRLKNHLTSVQSASSSQPFVFDSSIHRMARISQKIFLSVCCKIKIKELTYKIYNSGWYSRVPAECDCRQRTIFPRERGAEG
jgi:hypothetical protein